MSLMQVVGASFASVPLSHANSLLSQLSVPASQPAQPQTRPTVAQSSDPPPYNTRLGKTPDTVSELHSRTPRASDQQWMETDPGLNTPEERRRLCPEVKPLNRPLFTTSALLSGFSLYSSTCLAAGTPTADRSSWSVTEQPGRRTSFYSSLSKTSYRNRQSSPAASTPAESSP